MTSLNPFAPFQSIANRLDVDGNGSIAPIDVLQIINELNRNGSYLLPTLVPMPIAKIQFWDTNGDGSIAPIDALLVINTLNRLAVGEGEPDADESGTAFTLVPEQASTTDLVSAPISNNPVTMNLRGTAVSTTNHSHFAPISSSGHRGALPRDISSLSWWSARADRVRQFAGSPKS